ncbi:hypothetical protein INT47_008952, partial [Mucor saturninus]
FLDQRNRD